MNKGITKEKVTRTSYGFEIHAGEATAIGERTPLAHLSALAAACMAIAKALINLATAHVRELKRMKLSANWMSVAGPSVVPGLNRLNMRACARTRRVCVDVVL